MTSGFVLGFSGNFPPHHALPARLLMSLIKFLPHSLSSSQVTNNEVNQDQ